ncbi:DUF6683 family protein [Niabella beijingensis]|uniref:DUF6683 family protein n=1 Tax=Niabella beijingensis TaxID=2872700 RepID=UPI001CBEF5D2|nr:DUF6683 family protein [Niabella beijingensis]MBZ4190411.1 hypothetical protein [Niabella beijingensis]
MKKNRFSRCFLLLFSFGITSVNSHAQIGNPGLIYQGAFNNAMFMNTQTAIRRSMQKQAASGYKAQSNTSLNNRFSYTPSATVRQKLTRSIAESMAGTNKPAIQSNINMLTRAALLRDFENLLRQYDFNSHNLADVFAAYIIVSWETASGNDASNSRKGIEAFRKEVHQTFSATPEMAQLSNEQKQTATETLSYLAILTIMINRELATKGNSRAITQVRDNMARMTLQVTGMDVSQYLLTPKGLVKK